MPVRFQKMHGAGNDFVLLDLRDQDFHLDAKKVAQLGDRHTGIGFDQMLVLRPASDPRCLAEYEIWNADGSRCEQCGNGVRCIALYLQSRAETPHGEFHLQGPVAVVSVESLENQQFRVNMGPPVFEAEKIPLSLEASSGWYEMTAEGQTLRLGAVSMGNPHALLEVADIQLAEVDSLGPLISAHPAFPHGCNTGFAEIIDRGTIALRVYERGAGATRSCGSGACAAAAILIRSGKLDSRVLVKQVGGSLIIEWKGPGKPIFMTGPAVHLFEGILQ